MRHQPISTVRTKDEENIPSDTDAANQSFRLQKTR
jgi:hypothetical protein